MAGHLDPRLESKLAALERKSQDLAAELAAPETVADAARYRDAGKAFADLKPVVDTFEEYRKAESDLEGARGLLEEAGDADLREMAAEEVKALESRLASLEDELKILLVPTDPADAKNVVLEIRAGTGGDEATLFAGEIFRMYSRFAETMGWKVRTTDLSESAVGGVKEAIALIEGDRVFSRLKFESGVHRVQRVPATESQGRIHTSAVTVAVLPEADEVEVKIDEKDLRVDTFCSSGPGGQSVNTTDSAVRVKHIPSGIVVQCQDERSQLKNKAKALKVLRARLLDMEQQKQEDELARTRKGMVSTGDRSAKIRTYNFPQDRLTDHRIGLTVHSLEAIMAGELDPIVAAIQTYRREQALQTKRTGS